MKKKIKSKAIKKTIPLTKSLGELMKDEDGFVSKETILKVGLSTVAALGVTTALTDAAGIYGVQGNYSHTNTVAGGPGSNCITHTNITSYSSY